MLAAPFAISDLEIGEDGRWKNIVLDAKLHPVVGSLTDAANGASKRMADITARGITGTGVVAAVAVGLESGLISLPGIRTPDRMLHFQDGITFSEADLGEAGKAMGAIRAGHRTLIEEVGISDATSRRCTWQERPAPMSTPSRPRPWGWCPGSSTPPSRSATPP